MRRYICILMLVAGCLCLCTTIQANDLAVYANATVYENPAFDTVVLVEFPFSVNREEFEFYKSDSASDKLVARIFAQVDLYDVAGNALDSNTVYFSVSVQNKKEALKKDFRIFNKMDLLCKPGIYNARITVIDVVSKNKGTFYIENINVVPPQKNNINISGVNLAYMLHYVGEEGMEKYPNTYINGYSVFINPISVFSQKDTIMHVYGEIYNLKYSEGTEGKYQILFNALHENGELYKMLGSSINKKPGSSVVFTKGFNISEIPKGHYNLQIIAADIDAKTIDTLMFPFHKIITEEVMLAAKDIKKYIDPYDTLSLSQKLQLVTYLLNGEQLQTLDNLGEIGKENFLQMYWQDNDSIPSTPINEFRNEILNRYYYVNENFSTDEFKSNGWKTDRARILMKYGVWEERDDHEAPMGGSPFVIWEYNSIGGGLVFVFEDTRGDDEYRLVHSNAIGERFSQVWDDRIKRGFMDFMER